MSANMKAEWVVSKSSRRQTTRLNEIWHRHPLWMRTASGFVVLMIVCAVFAAFDDRTFNGISVWAKPFKFSLSLAVYFATLAWFVPLLPNGYMESRKGRWLTWIPIACAVFEIAYIGLQAGRAEASHFNNTSLFYSVDVRLHGQRCRCIGIDMPLDGSRDTPAPRRVEPVCIGGGYRSGTDVRIGGRVRGLSRWADESLGGRNAERRERHVVDEVVQRRRRFACGALLRHARDAGTAVVGSPACRVRTPRRVAVGIVVGAAFVYTLVCVYTFVQALNGVPVL